MAALAGLIIHATYNLITPPKSLYRYWQLSPFELVIWVVGVVLALFTSLETSIYVTIALSLTLLLVRLARTKGRFMGRVRIGRVAIDVSVSDSGDKSCTSTSSAIDVPIRDAYLPQDRMDATNPSAPVEAPHPGIFVYRFTEGFNYVNQVQQMDTLLRHVIENTRRTRADDGIRPSDRLWNDPGPTRASAAADANKPLLRAIVLDFSAVNNIDITSLQGLIDTRNFLDRHAAPATVEWHFASVTNRWTRRALAVAGFGYPIADKPESIGNWAPVYNVARSFAGATPDDVREDAEAKSRVELVVDEERSCKQPMTKAEFEMQQEPITVLHDGDSDSSGSQTKEDSRPPFRSGARVLLYGMDRPFFHVDLVEAVDSAVTDAEKASQGQR
jgi:solute carrier family 26 (sodium-independent sulfate anion transporter), member 11